MKFYLDSEQEIVNILIQLSDQQLALIDKRMLTEGQSNDILYQQKDQLFYDISKNHGLEIKRLISETIPKFRFTKFIQLDQLIGTWNLEIIGPSLSGKSQILNDIQVTMSDRRILYLTTFQDSPYQIRSYQEAFMALNMVLENKNHDLILIDGLDQILYVESLNLSEILIEELQRLLYRLQVDKVQVVVTSTSKSKDLYPNTEFMTQDKIFQKSIIPWGHLWHSQLSILRNHQKTRLQYSNTFETNFKVINL